MKARRPSRSSEAKKEKRSATQETKGAGKRHAPAERLLLKGLPELPGNQVWRRNHYLVVQRTVGNQCAQRLLQRQNESPTVTVRQPVDRLTPTVQRQQQAAPVEKRLPNAAPSAATLVAQDFPHLKLPPEQLAILQKVLDARLAIKKGQQRLRRLNVTVMQGQPQGASDQVRKYERISREIDPYYDVLRLNKFLHIPSELILGDDILSKDKKERSALIAFRESLYKTVIAQKTRLPIAPGLKPRPVFSALEWGPGHWNLTHKGGKVGFNDLMRKQKWNLAYQSALLGERLELTEKMLEQRRKLGGKLVNATGKKLGETYGLFLNSTIKVKQELGPIGGYYDDPEGRMKLTEDYLRFRGARCVIRGPDDWLHIFALEKFTSRDMKGAWGDDYVYLLTNKGEVTAERVTTSDGFELEHGSGKTGTGWRMKQTMGEVEQFAVGAFFGDVVQDPSVTMSVGQIIIGCIPIVGQIADARDVAAGAYKIWKTGGKDGKVQTLLALVGFIPLFGDAVKAAREAFTRAGREAAKEAFAKTVREGVGEATDQLAKKIIKEPDKVASALKMSKKELSELSDLGEKALAKGGEAAEKYAQQMTKHFDAVGGNAAAVVVIGGGKWTAIAKALSKSPAGEALGKRMHAWRVSEFDKLGKRLEKKAGDFGPDVASGKPKMVRTGTESYLSDVDVSFMGPHSSVHRNAAIREMEQKFGSDWSKLFDADIFADPTRLHKFDQPLAAIGGKSARDAEKRIVKEAELNVLAKMLQTGADLKVVAKTAKELGVDMSLVTARQKEIAKLSTDYLASMLRQGKPTAQVEKMAKEMGVSMEAVRAHLKSGQDIYRQLELKMDVLHKRFEQAAGNPAKQAQIAEEMAAIQGKLNAAVPGPYMTPGGGAKHVTHRERKIRKQGPQKALSPALGYTALLDDFYMLQHALQDVGATLTEKQAKSMAKYGDRLLVSAGQFGTDMAKQTSTRVLWEDIERLLKRARLEKGRPDLALIQSKLDEVKKILVGQLNQLAKAAKSNADTYLATLKPGVRQVKRVDAKAVRQMLTRTDQVIAKQLALIQRISIRRQESNQQKSK